MNEKRSTPAESASPGSGVRGGAMARGPSTGSAAVSASSRNPASALTEPPPSRSPPASSRTIPRSSVRRGEGKQSAGCDLQGPMVDRRWGPVDDDPLEDQGGAEADEEGVVEAAVEAHLEPGHRGEVEVEAEEGAEYRDHGGDVAVLVAVGVGGAAVGWALAARVQALGAGALGGAVARLAEAGV